MSTIKLLIDTNVVIGLEDAKQIDAPYSELARRCGEKNIGIFVHEASAEDVARDKDAERRAVTLSKLPKYQQLGGIALPPREAIEADFGTIAKPNDKVDVALLVALRSKAVDFLVTQDADLHARAERAGLGDRTFTVQGFLAWIRQTYDPAEVRLPYIEEKLAHQIDQSDEIFASLREGYPRFDRWWSDVCVKQHRPCWIVTIGGELAGIVVRKDHEPHADAQTRYPGPEILKICTFKVKAKFRGQKFGEQLLKQVLWFAQRNRYDLTYITAYPKEALLIDLLRYYGFEHTKSLPNGEWVLEKPLSCARLVPLESEPSLAAHKRCYPRFSDGGSVQVFCVPIQGDYHVTLFPEIAQTTTLPLFPDSTFAPALRIGRGRDPGNTIRKVYVCRAPTTAIKPGDLLLFYLSKSPALTWSQCITTVGVAELVTITYDLEDLLRLTAKRSAFSAIELEKMLAASATPLKVIDFLLAGHIDPPIDLAWLQKEGVFGGSPPQSIMRLSAERYVRLKPRLNLGFEL